MQLAARFPENSQVGKFSSVRAALGAGSPRPSPARRPAAELLRECAESWLEARASLLRRRDDLHAELQSGPLDLPHVVRIWARARVLLAESRAADAKLAAKAVEAVLGTD